MITVTFYGLAISLAAFVTGLYVWYTGATEVNILQGIIFALISFCASYFLPKMLTPKGEEKAQ
jgi:membrane protein implicated in regulation of membrane protease activity